MKRTRWSRVIQLMLIPCLGVNGSWGRGTQTTRLSSSAFYFQEQALSLRSLSQHHPPETFFQIDPSKLPRFPVAGTTGDRRRLEQQAATEQVQRDTLPTKEIAGRAISENMLKSMFTGQVSVLHETAIPCIYAGSPRQLWIFVQEGDGNPRIALYNPNGHSSALWDVWSISLEDQNLDPYHLNAQLSHYNIHVLERPKFSHIPGIPISGPAQLGLEQEWNNVKNWEAATLSPDKDFLAVASVVSDHSNFGHSKAVKYIVHYKRNPRTGELSQGQLVKTPNLSLPKYIYQEPSLREQFSRDLFYNTAGQLIFSSAWVLHALVDQEGHENMRPTTFGAYRIFQFNSGNSQTVQTDWVVAYEYFDAPMTGWFLQFSPDRTRALLPIRERLAGGKSGALSLVEMDFNPKTGKLQGKRRVIFEHNDEIPYSGHARFKMGTNDTFQVAYQADGRGILLAQNGVFYRLGSSDPSKRLSRATLVTRVLTGLCILGMIGVVVGFIVEIHPEIFHFASIREITMALSMIYGAVLTKESREYIEKMRQDDFLKFTNRERQVIELLQKKWSVREIAYDLSLADKTVLTVIGLVNWKIHGFLKIPPKFTFNDLVVMHQIRSGKKNSEIMNAKNRRLAVGTVITMLHGFAAQMGASLGKGHGRAAIARWMNEHYPLPYSLKAAA